MKKQTIILLVVVILIVAATFFLESSKPKVGEVNDADIKAEDLLSNNNNTGNTAVENNITSGGVSIRNDYPNADDLKRIAKKAKKYPRAKELVDPEGYVNVDNITIAENIGKNVVLVDFWTYSCINCQRTLPYLEAWWEKYKDQGLVIIGVHTPEFDFEKKYDNLVRATEKFGVKYPVVQDNDYQTWRAYGNRYWPRKYLIDIDGFIVYDHIGEGAYAEGEKEIHKALAERNKVLGIDKEVSSGTVNPEADKPSAGSVLTPEIYFGYGFSRDQFGNNEGWQPGETVDYSYPTDTEQSNFYLEGRWKNNNDNMELVSEEGGIKLSFLAKKVNIVASADSEVKAEIYVDGEFYKEVMVKDAQLYNIASFDSIKRSMIEINAEKGLKAYTFTFG